jgi:uncharacterized repeat protein (TIGR01451 family)
VSGGAPIEGGAVYVYNWDGTNWVPEATLLPPSDVYLNGQRFGASLDISGNTIVVGAPNLSVTASNGGGIYVLTHNGTTWSTPQRIVSPIPALNEYFGSAVTIEDDRINVGMTDASTVFERVYVFRRINSNWTYTQAIHRNSSNLDFGQTITLANDELWASMPLETVAGFVNAGSMYAYQYTPDADLVVELADIPGWIAGFDMTYEITVTNNGQENATGVSVVDTLPLNVSFLSASAGCTPAANVVTCTIGNLNIGASQTVYIDVNINGSATGILTNQATVSSALPDPNTPDNTATQQTQVVPAPGVPTPLSPANGSSTNNTQPTFTWSAVNGITNYEIQLDIVDPPLATYSGFNIGTTFKPPAPLLYTTYYWRIRSLDEFDIPSPWSDTQILIVYSPDTVAPVRSVSNTAFPTLSWIPVSWANGYEVEISADKIFMTVVYSSGTLPPTATSYTSLDELPSGTWYWRVRALKSDDVTWSAWSNVETIQIIVP